MPQDKKTAEKAIEVSGIVTLTTDFGLGDHYVGAVKGVIAGIAPGIRVIDISHGIPAHDVAEGAFAIAQAWRYFPPGSVHVVVIDPGVGSSRRALAAAAGGHLFVAPDNGVLSQVFEQEPNRELRAIDLRHGLAPVSRTFHGRDLFAPVAARLASGMEFAQVGPPLDDAAMLPPSAPRNGAGRVLHVDGFGNVVTSFRRGDLPTGGGVRLGNLIVSEWADTYADAPGAAPFLITGSSGYVEVSVNRGSAASLAGVRAGAEVSAI